MSAKPTMPLAIQPLRSAATPTLKSIKRRRVLAVGVAESIRAALEAACFDGDLVVATIDDVAEVLAAWIHDRERFDVALCNVRERDETGVHVYRAVTRARPDLAGRFVFVVDDGTQVRRHYLLGEIANPTLEASIDARALRALVRRH